MRRKQNLKELSVKTSSKDKEEQKVPMKTEMVTVDLENSKSSLICHLCLCKSEQSLSLFEESSKKMLENIRTVFQIEPIQNEAIPDQICTYCIEKINEFIAFRQMVIDNHRKLQLEVEEAKHQLIVEPCVKIESESDVEPELEPDPEPDSEPKTVSRYVKEEKVKRASHEKDDEDDVFLRNFFTFDCPKCSQTFPRFYALSHHFRTKHKYKDFSVTCCQADCKRTFKNRHMLLRHLTRHDIRNVPLVQFQCHTCEKFFKDKSSIHSHVKRNSCEKIAADFASRTTYQCDLCSALYFQKFRLERHFVISHGVQRPGKTRSYQCSQCPKSYLSAKSLKTHIRIIHLRVEEVICDACAKVCCSKQSLRIHYRTMHVKKAKIGCPACGKMVNSRSALTTHLQAHQQQPVACEICSKVFRNRFSLKNHHRLVHEASKHVCSECGKAFPSKSRLKEHRTIHGFGEGLHKCKWCDSTFNFSSNKTHHMKHLHPAEWIQYMMNREAGRRGPTSKMVGM